MNHCNDSLMEEVEETQETQQQTQSTQQASQQAGIDVNGHLWGYLQPCSSDLTRIDFWKVTPRYKLGRSKDLNDCVLPGAKATNIVLSPGMALMIPQTSLSSTIQVMALRLGQINGSKIGRGQTRVLREGNEIAFGTHLAQNGSLEDYRFIYRHTASGPPNTGLYAFYDVIGELGRGSFAVVMKAVCRRTGEYVAVKMIQASKSVRSPGEEPTDLDRVKREIEILESLEHPNICGLKEVFFQQGSQDINLVLELIEGGDLLGHILQKGALSEAESQHITYQLCDALAYIHSKNVTHRDLKPENVLLTKDVPPKVKVADFGLAKVVHNLTMLKTMCGTPSYLAPEVVAQTNNEGYDNLVDSWSVGVIVFAMLTHNNPFIEEEKLDVRTRILQRTIDWSLLTSKDVSAEAIDFVECLLETDPRQRMTLADSLQHPWLKSHVPVYSPAGSYTSTIPTDAYSMVSGPTTEGSFRGSVNEDLHNMHIEFASSTPVLPGSFPKSTNESSKGINKRVHSELTPLPEGFSDSNEEVNMGPTPAPRKKGRVKSKSTSTSSPNKLSESVAATPTRRSGRLRKTTRRV
ncbi:hypothetical protein C0995_002201 [Termitomyces sp. Mi166|nr:hypothetical protein C0995_002201 [Termitomyces sp. Mi166\